jgi:hypothetical protein
MGKQSRLKRERRNTPLPSFTRPLETRWGTGPRARAFGGMVQGLGMGLFGAVVCLVIGLGRMLLVDADVGELADGMGWYFAGWLVGGAVAGALAPLRHRMGGRRGQAFVMAGIALLLWMPIVDEKVGTDPVASVIGWAVGTVIIGLIFARFLSIVDPDPPTPPVQATEPDLRTGRRNELRR